MASSSYAMEDARRHLRKEEFDLIYPPNSNGSSGTSSKVPIATMYGGRHQSRDASDYYEYYPKCIRPFLPKVLFISICPLMISLCLIQIRRVKPQRRVGNMMILYERNDRLLVTCGPHWPGVGAVGTTSNDISASPFFLSVISCLYTDNPSHNLQFSCWWGGHI